MSPTWGLEDDQIFPPLTAGDQLRFLVRAVGIGTITFGGLGILLVLRVFEQPLFRARRPITPWITQGVCRLNYAILGIRRTTTGAPMRKPGAIVANHVSWLDIFTLNALDRIYFVAKQEVSGWPGIGWLARATGTVFIERRRAAAAGQRKMFHERLRHGHKLLFFPEGTSTDGRRVLEFKSTLFDAFFDDLHRDDTWIQPITQIYTAPPASDPRFYGWWGATEFGPHFRAVLASRRPGAVEVVFHDPVRVADFDNRKDLAKYLEGVVRSAMASDQDMAET